MTKTVSNTAVTHITFTFTAKSTNNNLAPAAAAYNIAGSDVDAATLARLTFHCDALFDKIRKFLLADADR